MRVSCLVVTSRRSRDRNAGFSAADDADARSVVFVFIQINTLRTSGKSQSIKRTACMLNFIYIVQSKWYLRLKISVQGPFKHHVYLLTSLIESRFGPAVRRQAGKQNGLGSIPLRLSFLFKTVVVCGHCLVILSLRINETLKWLSLLPILMQESLWWWQCIDSI